MELLLLRHARAEVREVFARSGRDDAQRPLTAEGCKRMRQAARGLRTLVPRIDLIVASPLTRTLQTAAILAEVYGGRVESREELAPGGRVADLLPWLNERRGCEVAALVGHEPDLGQFAAWLLTGGQGDFMTFKKGGAALIAFDGPVEEAGGRLLWAMPPAAMRRLRR